jgi:nucleoside-diphosphate-sugar epimerase
LQILVIGGTGFTGVHVLRRLVEDGHNVAVFHRGRTETELPLVVQHIHGEREDLSTFVADFKKFAPDVVLDMIPYVEQDAFTLIDTFRGMAKRVVAISSMDVYAAYGRFRRSEAGEPEQTPFDEDAPLRSNFYPYREYAQSSDDLVYNYDKILVERVVMNDSKLPGTVLRLPKVYGFGDNQHRAFEYVKRMDDGRPAILLEKRKAQWRWTRGYTENVAVAIVLAVMNEQAANRIYNVGEADALTEAEWARELGCAAGWDGEVVAAPRDILPKHLAEDYDYRHNLAANTSRIREELGYAEPISREEALKQTVAWERDNPPKNIDAEKFDYAAEDAALMRFERKSS